MGDFTTLPVDSGVGDYHFNRFRIAFQARGPLSAEALAADLIDRFPKHFKSAYAEVLPSGRSHEGKPTIHFHGNAKFLVFDLAKPHDDWVVQQWVDRKIGFTAQTLKRNFFVAGDDVAVATAPVARSSRGCRSMTAGRWGRISPTRSSGTCWAS